MVNVGNLDRAIRAALGTVALLAVFVPPAADWLAGWGAAKYLVTLVGAVLVATAIFRFCPAYRLLGISSCKVG